MKLSVVVPARNEADCVGSTIRAIAQILRHELIPSEILVVDDGSTDGTTRVVLEAASEYPEILLIQNHGPQGFGYAVRAGLSAYSVKGGRVIDYPLHKLVINRAANRFIALLFNLRLNDTTNAFKCYRRHVIDGLQPLLSAHFNLTVELPLKAIVRGYSYTIVPISWQNRATGVSKLKLREMGSRYLFIVLYALIEKLLSRGDYARRTTAPAESVKQGSPHA